MDRSVTHEDIRDAVRALHLSGRPVCAHSSLRSFGHVDGGADALVDAFLAEHSTLLVPTFSWDFLVLPTPELRPERNAWDYDQPSRTRGLARPYTPETETVDQAMGSVSAAVLRRVERVRGRHPLNSFSAVGPSAARLMEGQTPLDVYAPLRALGELGGSVALIGVGPERMTLLHAAEELAGRRLFRRWAKDDSGRVREVSVGSCSDGFGAFAAVLDHLGARIQVGASPWIVYPAAETLEEAAEAIRRDPELTRCGTPGCIRCRDAIAGGPLSSQSAPARDQLSS